MANNCAFDMRITGGEAEIKELISMLRWENEFHGLGRVFSMEIDSLEKTDVPDIFTIYLSGDCANSVKSSMRDDGIRFPSLESESKRLGLVVEVFSSEPGCEFQEHFLVAKGQVIIDACVHYEEHVVDNFGGVDNYNRIHGTNFTKDMVNCNGEVCIGGFGAAYMDWHDAAEYFQSVGLSVDDRIRAATEKGKAAEGRDIRPQAPDEPIR